MSAEARLERRYRRLLAFYPPSFRAGHGEEVLAVLMAGAEDGQRRPQLAEAVNLLRTAILMRLRHYAKRQSSWGRAHANFIVPLRIVIGLWLLLLTGILYGFGHGGWWGALLLPSAALHFFLAYRLRRPVKS